MGENTNKIGFFLENLSGGGEEKIIVHMANTFASHGYQVDLLLTKAEGPLVDEISSSVNLINFNLNSHYLSFPKLISYLQKEKPDTFISTLELSNLLFLISKKLAGVNTISIIRVANTVSMHYRIFYKKWLEKLLLKIFYPWADHIIAVSNGVAADLEMYAKIPRASISTIYNPVISSDLINQSKQPLEHAWFKSGMPPVILGVGRLTRQKNFPRLIQAFNVVQKSMEANLLILGTGEEKPKLLELISSLGLEDKVELAGYAKNPYAYMSRSSVFVLSSDWEGLPTVLIEAMAIGCPVVATNAPSGAYEILDGGKYGNLVPLNDDEALAKAIIATLSNNSKPVDQTWLDQFSFERGFKSHLEIVEA